MADKDKGILEGMRDTYMEGVRKTGDDIHRMVGTEKGKALDKAAKEKERKGLDIGKVYDAYSKQQEAGRYNKGGSVKSASARADGCAMRGKTRGKMV
jgi:hypothetical protein